jgi:hypothetical protein
MRTLRYLALCFGIASAALAQCTQGVNMPPPYLVGARPVAWPLGISIAYIEFNGIRCNGATCYPSNTSGRLGPQIEDGNNAWSNLANSYASFYLYGYTQPPVNTTLSFTPYIYWLAVNSPGEVDPQGDWGITTPEWHNYGTDSIPVWRVGSASIRVYGDMDVQYKANVVAHELGHTFALGDCPTCQLGSTVMYQPANTARSVPSACDIQQMNYTAY